jgi:Tfp pilus assembly protein PilF
MRARTAGIVVVFLGAFVMAGSCAHRAPPPPHPRAVALQAAGAAALTRGDLDRAAGQFSLALEYEPRMAEAENGLGLVALAYGDQTLAEKHFRTSLAMDEDFAEAHLNLGGILLGRGVSEEALEHFRAALAIDPGYPAARLAVGETLLRLGRLEDARWELAKLCEADPQNAAAHAAHALVLARLDRAGAAEVVVRRALALDPRLPVAHRARAEILRRRGDPVGAEQELRIVIKAQPTSADDRLALGVVLAEQKRWDDAGATLSAAASLAPRQAEIQFALAFVELGRERPPAAVTAARRALELRLPYPRARLLLAEAYYRAGDAVAGQAQLRSFVDEAPADMSEEKTRALEVLAGRSSPGIPLSVQKRGGD